MTAPINIDDLTQLSSGISQNSFLIIEDEPDQSTTRATLRKIRAIDISALPLDTSPNLQTAYFFSQNSLGVKSKSFAYNVTLFPGDRIYAYQATYPSGWKIVPGTGDRLLAVAGGATYLQGGTSAGTWTSSTVNGNNSPLTPEQMPPHTHRSQKTKSEGGVGAFVSDPPLRGKTIENDKVPEFNYHNSEPSGGNQTHNHGDLWRPLANVGIIIEKL